MRDCPQCGTPVDGPICGNCGSREKGGRAGSGHDRNANRCAWNANGERCRYPGTLSHSTLGQGPWYCAGHSRCTEHGRGEQIIAASLRQWPDAGDYTTEALVALTRRQFLAGASHREPGEEE